jgi:hypothetical protein
MPLLSQPICKFEPSIAAQFLVESPRRQKEIAADRQVAVIGRAVRRIGAREAISQLLAGESGERVSIRGNLPVDSPGSNDARRIAVRLDMCLHQILVGKTGIREKQTKPSGGSSRAAVEGGRTIAHAHVKHAETIRRYLLGLRQNLAGTAGLDYHYLKPGCREGLPPKGPEAATDRRRVHRPGNDYAYFRLGVNTIQGDRISLAWARFHHYLLLAVISQVKDQRWPRSGSYLSL